MLLEIFDFARIVIRSQYKTTLKEKKLFYIRIDELNGQLFKVFKYL